MTFAQNVNTSDQKLPEQTQELQHIKPTKMMNKRASGIDSNVAAM